MLIIRHPSSTSSIYYNPQHPPYSIYVIDSPFPQPLSRSSLVFLLVCSTNVMKICPQFFSIILLTNTGQNTDYKRQIRRAKMKYFPTNIMSWPMLIKHIPKTMPCYSMHYTLRAHIYTCGRTFTDMHERFWLNAFQGDSYGKSSHVSVILYCFQRYCNHFKKILSTTTANSITTTSLLLHSVFLQVFRGLWKANGGDENASTGKRKYGKGKYETAHFARMENACTEIASTNLQGWKTQVRKMQVQCKPSVR